MSGHDIDSKEAASRYDVDSKETVSGYDLDSKEIVSGYDVDSKEAVSGQDVDSKEAMSGYNVTHHTRRHRRCVQTCRQQRVSMVYIAMLPLLRPADSKESAWCTMLCYPCSDLQTAKRLRLGMM